MFNYVRGASNPTWTYIKLIQSYIPGPPELVAPLVIGLSVVGACDPEVVLGNWPDSAWVSDCPPPGEEPVAGPKEGAVLVTSVRTLIASCTTCRASSLRAIFTFNSFALLPATWWTIPGDLDYACSEC